uniref:N-acetyltransferase n=1 Tax=Oscillatoriales cyanobacterium SpSt-402 TaxID=2282168 RepID=A0A832H4E7_9CYAN
MLLNSRKSLVITTEEAITLHQATTTDAAVLVELGRRTMRQTYGTAFAIEDIDRVAEQRFNLKRLTDELANPEIRYLLVTANQQPCGYAKLEPTSTPDAITGMHPIQLVHLYVDSQWIGKGIGAKQMQGALEFVTSNGFATCWLQVLESNHRAISFYRRWGFVEVGSDLYPAGETSVPVLLMMRCSVDAAT